MHPREKHALSELSVMRKMDFEKRITLDTHNFFVILKKLLFLEKHLLLVMWVYQQLFYITHSQSERIKDMYHFDASLSQIRIL